MKLIQLILVPSLIVFIVIYFRRFRTLLLDRLIVLAMGVVGATMIIMPDWSMAIAHGLGVGRGADLVSYLGLAGLSLFGLMLWSKLRDLDEKITEIARLYSIDHSRGDFKPDKPPGTKPD